MSLSLVVIDDDSPPLLRATSDIQAIDLWDLFAGRAGRDFRLDQPGGSTAVSGSV